MFENNHPSSADSSPSPDRSTGFQATCIAASRHGGCTVLGFSYGSFVVFVACCGVLCVVDSGRGPEADYVFSPREIGSKSGDGDADGVVPASSMCDGAVHLYCDRNSETSTTKTGDQDV